MYTRIPPEMREIVLSYCSPKTLGLFAQTSRQAEADTAFLRLLESLVYAEPETYKMGRLVCELYSPKQVDQTRLAAIAILTRHPDLLFRKGRITDHYGRKHEASPYR